MAITAPIIGGEIGVVRIRQEGRTYGLKRILTLIRAEIGVPPFRLRRDPESPEESDSRDVAIYLTSQYSELSDDEISRYFRVHPEYVRDVATNPLDLCNLSLLSQMQMLIEQELHWKVPVNLASQRILTGWERDRYREETRLQAEWTVIPPKINGSQK